MPIRTASGAMSTILVVNRTSGCSSRETSPITYVSPTPSHGWWFTVNEWSMPRPLISAGATSRLWHRGHSGAGGCRKLPQDEQRNSRNRPSAPEVQKNALGSSSVGSTRGTELGLDWFTESNPSYLHRHSLTRSSIWRNDE